MSKSNINTSCSGCFPEYQPNQMAHMDEGGCLYCPEIFDSDSLFHSVDNDKPILYEESSFNIIDNNNECSICYENINELKNNCTTECGHSFCFNCIATSLVYKNLNCPYCRSKLVDAPNKENNIEEDEEYEETEDDDEYDEEEDEDEYDEDENYGIYQTNTVCDIDEIISRIDKNGFTKEDIISILIGRYKKDEKYTNEYIYKINDKFHKLIEDADNEATEQKLFEAEDKLF